MMKQVTFLQAGTDGISLVLGLCLVALMLCDPVVAAETQPTRLSLTIENPRDKTLVEQDQMLDLAPLQEASGLVLFGSRQEVDLAQKELTAEHLLDQVFRIYDAQTVLSRDDDDDGFYHQLRVTFDADVDHADAFVYARLFLSFEGGPWNHYFTTDVFHILEDIVSDDYEVVTRLLEGYPTGYYDVLIELYDADLDTHVASYGPNEDAALRVLPLEDAERDYPYSDSDGGGGSFGLAGLLMLTLWRRYSNRRLTPTLSRA